MRPVVQTESGGCKSGVNELPYEMILHILEFASTDMSELLSLRLVNLEFFRILNDLNLSHELWCRIAPPKHELTYVRAPHCHLIVVQRSEAIQSFQDYKIRLCDIRRAECRARINSLLSDFVPFEMCQFMESLHLKYGYAVTVLIIPLIFHMFTLLLFNESELTEDTFSSAEFCQRMYWRCGDFTSDWNWQLKARLCKKTEDLKNYDLIPPPDKSWLEYTRAYYWLFTLLYWLIRSLFGIILLHFVEHVKTLVKNFDTLNPFSVPTNALHTWRYDEAVRAIKYFVICVCVYVALWTLSLLLIKYGVFYSSYYGAGAMFCMWLAVTGQFLVWADDNGIFRDGEFEYFFVRFFLAMCVIMVFVIYPTIAIFLMMIIVLWNIQYLAFWKPFGFVSFNTNNQRLETSTKRSVKTIFVFFLKYVTYWRWKNTSPNIIRKCFGDEEEEEHQKP